MKKYKKIIFIIAAIILVTAFFFLVKYLKSVKDYKSEVSSITYSDIDISNLQNGTYIGECDVDFIYAKVEVIIYNQEIIDIKLLEHRNDRGQAAEVILDRMMEEQSIEVDAVSSATNSSKVIKKAVENALITGVQ